MPQAKAKASLGASLLQSKRGAARLPPAPAEAMPAAEAAPGSSGALEGSGIFFQKGVASAAGFRPNYWSYEKEPQPKSTRLAVLPGGAAETTKISTLAQALAAPAEPAATPPRLTLLPPVGEEPATSESAPKVVPLAIAPAPAPQPAAVDDRETAPPAAEPPPEAATPTVRVLEERIEVLEEKVERIGAPPPAASATLREQALLGPAEIAALLAVAEDHLPRPAEPVAIAPCPASTDVPTPAAHKAAAPVESPALPLEPAASMPAPVESRLPPPAEAVSSEPPPPRAAAGIVEAEPAIAPERHAPDSAAGAPAPIMAAIRKAPMRTPVDPVPEPAIAVPAETAIGLAPEPVLRAPEPERAPVPRAVEPEPSDVAARPAEDRPPSASVRAEAPAPLPPNVETVKETLLAELGTAIESVMSRRWYGVPSGTPLAPAGSIPATLPTVDHSSLIAELAAANPVPPEPPPAPRRLPLDVIIAGLVGGGLALAYVLWGIPAPVAGAFRDLLRLVW